MISQFKATKTITSVETFTTCKLKQKRKCVQKFTYSKSYKIFPNLQYTVWCEQNKHIAGNFHSTQKRKKRTTKHD